MDPEALRAGVHPGEVIGGKYRVEKVLGVGGMGVVVAAHHLELDERVALKFLLPQALADAEASERFLREARAAVKIKSEHVARVIDVGKFENGAPYIVMEYLEGIDLATWLADRGRLEVEQAIDFVLQACEALAEAHVLGIVHRDLKPANLFAVKRAHGKPSIKVLDFGISKLVADGALGPVASMTRTGAMVGTPAYMSPEQIHTSKSVDARTDVWALGVILFELVTAATPFNGDSLPELAMRITYDEAPNVSTIREDVSAGVAHVIAKCLAKEREQRYASVGELALALRDYAPRHARRSVERVLGTLAAAGLSEPIELPDSVRPMIEDTAPQPPIPTPAQMPVPIHTTPMQTPAPLPMPMSIAMPPHPRVPMQTPTPTAAPALVPSPGRGVAIVVAVLVIACAVGAIALLMRRSWAGTSRHGDDAATGLVASPSPTAPSSSPATPLTAEPSLPSAPVTSPIASADPPPSQTRHPLRGGPRAPPSASASASPSASATPPPSASGPGPECHPPYFIDSAGHRQYKPECL